MNQPRPPMGLIGATALVVGSMIGSGVFLLPATLAPFGAASLLGWALTMTGALALALVFSSMVRKSPAHGGAYAYARAAFGNGVGFIVAWSYWVCMWCGNAALSVAFAGSLGAIFPSIAAKPALGASIALLALWACTITNLLGIRNASIVQIFTTFLKIIPLILFGLLGLFYIELDHYRPFNPSSQSLLATTTSVAALTLWAFLGLEAATIPATSIRNPERNIARATIIGILLAGIATVLTCTVVLGLLPSASLQNSAAPLADAASLLWGTWAGKSIGIVAALSCYGAMNGWVLLQAQVPMAAANDQVFPKLFAVQNKYHVPAFGLVLSSGLATVLVIANYSGSLVRLFEFSILLSTASCLIPYAVTCLAWMKANIAAPIYQWAIASIGLLYSGWALLGTGREALLWASFLLLAGWPVYFWLSQKR